MKLKGQPFPVFVWLDEIWLNSSSLANQIYRGEEEEEGGESLDKVQWHRITSAQIRTEESLRVSFHMNTTWLKLHYIKTESGWAPLFKSASSWLPRWLLDAANKSERRVWHQLFVSLEFEFFLILQWLQQLGLLAWSHMEKWPYFPPLTDLLAQ